MAFGRKQRILLVDDDADLRATLEIRFANAGFEVHQAENGRQGLELAAKLRPAAIILDVNMPGIDGFETCRRLRASRRTRNIPVIMLTALKRVGELEEGLEAGADTYLTKPFDGAELVEEVGEVVGGRRKKRERSRRVKETSNRDIREAVEKLRAAPRKLGEVARAVPGVLIGRGNSHLLAGERRSDRHRGILFEDDVQPIAPRPASRYLRFSPEVARSLAPDASVFEAPKKVLLRRTAPPLVAALDSEKRLVEKAVICVVPEGRNVKAEFLLGVLASRLAAFAWERAIERARAGLLPWVTPTEIEALPLPGPKGLAGRNYEEQVASLASELVRRTRLGPGGTAAPAPELMERLDKLVAEGYGLDLQRLKNIVS